jgi:hypothetical protein
MRAIVSLLLAALLILAAGAEQRFWFRVSRGGRFG